MLHIEAIVIAKENHLKKDFNKMLKLFLLTLLKIWIKLIEIKSMYMEGL